MEAADSIEKRLAEVFEERSVRRGAERYFDLRTAAAFVETCSAWDLAVIGVEGFMMSGDAIEPRLDLIFDGSPGSISCADDSWDEFRASVNRAATAFLQHIEDGDVHVSFVIFTRADWFRSAGG